MNIALFLGILVLSYLIGSIPFGLLVVRLATGKDIRRVESGRTGGTNAMRAAGVWAGVATALLDGLKGAATIWLARALTPDSVPGYVWLDVLAPVMAVLGHNYSIFLLERTPSGWIRLRGGAGGATTVGGAIGLWPLSVLIIVPLGALILFGIGYASVATMSVAFIATIIFALRATLGVSPWQYVLYGVITEALLVYALLPNIRRLLKGNERVVGWRARKLKKSTSDQTS